MNEETYGFRTRAVHAGGGPDQTTGARAVPIYQTTSFVFEDSADAADLFALQKFGNIYSRIANPTVASFEERVASLEGAIGGVATSSGQAAELLTFAALAGAGDHLVASAQLYGGTRTLLDVSLRRLGIDTTFVASDDPAAYAAEVRPNTKAIYTEVIGNPSGSIADLAALADVAHAVDLPLVVDSTLATPYLCRPMEHGADIVLHSATKFIGGHGTSIGGIVLESGRFPWDSGRFPQMTEPVASYNGLRFWENFAEYGFCMRLRVEQLRDFGACLSPFNAFLFLMGLETLALRMEQHVAERAGGRGVPRKRRAGVVGEVRGLARLAVPRAGQALCAEGAGSGLRVRREGRPLGGPGVHRVGRDVQSPRQHRRRPHARHPSRDRRRTNSSTTKRSSPRASARTSSGSPSGLENVEDIIRDLDRALDKAAGA